MDEEDVFKLADPHIAYYACRFVSRYPMYRSLFSFRNLIRSMEKTCIEWE